jgi:hypothetical protein
MSDALDSIGDLEAEIERLAEAAERCRKTIAAARILVAGGGVAVVALLSGAVGHRPEILVAAIAAIAGGTGLFGSSRGTLEELAAAIAARESRRNELIDTLDLQPAATPGPSSPGIAQS